MTQNQGIYLDHAASTPVRKEAMEAMLPYLGERCGNPGSIHREGCAAKAAVEVARNQVARRFGCLPHQVIFTHGGTYANNLAVLGLEETLRDRGKMHIIVSAMEHKSVLAPVHVLEKRGFRVTYVSSPQGRITWQDIEPFVTDDTGLVIAMSVNNETGVVSDYASIAQECLSRQIWYHSDFVHGADVSEISFQDLPGLSSISLSGHKIGAPKGSGCLIVRNPADYRPLLFGGSQETGLYAGTENVPAIVAFGVACECLQPFHNPYVFWFIQQLSEKSGAEINTPISHMSWKTVSVFIPGADAETLVVALSGRGICISSGAACDSRQSTPSHVLTAMNIPADRAGQSVRLSFSSGTTLESLQSAIPIITDTVSWLRNMEQNKNKEDA